MNIVRALVGEDGFQVAHVAEDGVFVGDAIGAQDVARGAGHVERHLDVIALEHGDVGEVGAALIFETANLQGEQLPLGDFRNHVGEFRLDELMRGDGLVVPLLADLGVFE